MFFLPIPDGMWPSVAEANGKGINIHRKQLGWCTSALVAGVHMWGNQHLGKDTPHPIFSFTDIHGYRDHMSKVLENTTATTTLYRGCFGHRFTLLERMEASKWNITAQLGQVPLFCSINTSAERMDAQIVYLCTHYSLNSVNKQINVISG